MLSGGTQHACAVCCMVAAQECAGSGEFAELLKLRVKVRTLFQSAMQAWNWSACSI